MYGGGSRVLGQRTLTVCLASSIDVDQLRSQLHHLHFEASNTRAKANKARLRLMRLSEAAEKLQRQAVTSVQSGKENEARELLFQKKKTMQALEKTKSRIELLDELSRKLIEAITIRESQLVGMVALDIEPEKEDDATPVRIVSPHETPGENMPHLLSSNDDQELSSSIQNDTLDGSLQGLLEFSSQYGTSISNENDLTCSFKGITSYKDLLNHVDRHLSKVEDELDIVVKFSTMILDGEERPKSQKVQQIMEILDAVGRIRERISVITQTRVEKK